MNPFDRTVGQGIGSLLQAGHEDVSEAGAFNFAPKSEPVVRMADGGSAYSNDQLAQTIRDSIAKGKQFGDITQELSKSGVTPSQLNYVIGEMARSSSFTPQTSVGIPGTGQSFWTFLRDALKEGALTVGPMIAAPQLGVIGQGLGATGAYAPALGGAVVGGATAALSGKEGSDILKSAAIGALGGAGGELAKTLGQEAGQFAGNLFTDETASSYATQLAKGATEGGIRALPGAIATGDPGRALTGALMGGATNVAQYAMGDSSLPITKQQTEAGINFIRAVNSGNNVAAANAAATLINNPDITVATKAATLLKAVESGNPNAILAATQMLGGAVNKYVAAPSTGGASFQTSSIIEPGDSGGTIVPGEAGEDYTGDVLITDKREPVDLISLLDFDTGTKTLPKGPGQTVAVTGTRLPTEGVSDVADLLDVVKPTSQVPVVGKRITTDELGNLVNLIDKDLVDQRVDVTGKTVKPEDVTSQTVGVTSTKLPPETTTTPSSTPSTTPSTTTPSAKPPVVAPKKSAETVGFTPIPEAAPAQAFRPGVVTDAYEVLFGPGAPSLMGFTKAERAKQMLAQGREEEENRSETPYERLMSMADRDPVGTVDELMKIIGRG